MCKSQWMAETLKICFPASSFQSILFYISNFCSSGGHLQGLVTKQEDLTSFSHLVSTPGVIQSKHLYSWIDDTLASKNKLKL